MKKKLLLVPLILICLICLFTGINIGSCKKVTNGVNANVDNWKQVDSLDNHVFYIWTDTETDKEYILYHNTYYNEFSLCPR